MDRMTVEEKIDKVIRLLKGHWHGTGFGEKLEEEFKPELDRWWVACNKDNDSAIWIKIKPYYKNGYWTGGNFLQFYKIDTEELLRRLRPDIILPKPGECVEILAPKSFKAMAESLEKDCFKLTQKADELEKQNQKIEITTNRLDEERMWLNEKVTVLEKQKKKMRECMEDIEDKYLPKPGFVGVQIRKCLDSIDGVTNDKS